MDKLKVMLIPLALARLHCLEKPNIDIIKTDNGLEFAVVDISNSTDNIFLELSKTGLEMS